MRHVKKQKHMFHNQKNNHLLETCPQIIDMIELSDKDFKSYYKYVQGYKKNTDI